MFDSGCSETVDNPFKFTGQWYDKEISQYYLRARMYDPYLARFTTFDPVRGKLGEPLTMHKYLYCINDPINKTDPEGRYYSAVSAIITGSALYAHGIELAAYGASSIKAERWKFFDLAEATFAFMPMGMGLAAAAPSPRISELYGAYAAATVGNFTLDEMFHITGMSRLGGFAMEPLAFIGYTVEMYIAEQLLDITLDDMSDFYEWRHPW